MSTRNVPAPLFPYPPEEYDQNNFSDIVRAFSIFVDQQRNPGEARATKMTLTNSPSGDDLSVEGGGLVDEEGG